MVANYAGVSTQNDSRNDIIIRGNSPMGVLWRLEDIEIPNPNHFGALGTTGGPVNMVNNNLLANSDFLTGAFPAEFGNATAGAFDLNSVDYLLKPISREKLEHSIRKYRSMAEKHQTVDFQALMESLEGREARYKKRFAVNIGSRSVSVEASSVAWFYTLEKSTYLCTDDNRHYPIDFSLEHLEELLDPEQFYRVNRQYLVRYSAIQRIHILSKSRVKLELQLPAKEDLLVATARTHDFRLWLDR